MHLAEERVDAFKTLFEDGMHSHRLNPFKLLYDILTLSKFQLLIASWIELGGIQDFGFSTIFVFEKCKQDTISHKMQADNVLVRVEKTIDFKAGAFIIYIYQLNQLVPRECKDWNRLFTMTWC